MEPIIKLALTTMLIFMLAVGIVLANGNNENSNGNGGDNNKGKGSSGSTTNGDEGDNGKNRRNGITIEVKQKFKDSDGKMMVSKEIEDAIEFEQEVKAEIKSEIEGPLSLLQKELISKLQASLTSVTDEIEIEIESEDGEVNVKIDGQLTNEQQLDLDNLKKALQDSRIEAKIKIKAKDEEEEKKHRFAVEVLCPFSFDHEVEEDISLSDNINFQIIEINVKDIPKMAKDECVGKFGDEDAIDGITKYTEKKIRDKFIERAKKEKLDETRGIQNAKRIKEDLDEQLEIEVKQGKLEEKPNVSISPQFFITPNDATIKSLAAGKDRKSIYEYVASTTWVSDRQVFGTTEFWQLPKDFIEVTPDLETNPVAGKPVSDCSEKANTLVSMLRASGVPPEEVRVALGEINFGNIEGHAWAEILENGKWLVLEPSSGPFWNKDTNRVVNREFLPYDYFEGVPYPIVEIYYRYNDKFFQDLTQGKGNAPSTWDAAPSTTIGSAFQSGLSGKEGFALDNSTVLIILAVIAVVAFSLGKGKRK